MDLLSLPIPPRPTEFTPYGAPVGVAVDFEAYKWSDGTPWYEHRPLIYPTTQVVHTNAAQGEGSVQAAINWGNAGIRSNTHPHYQVGLPVPTKLVPTDRRAIGNSSLYTVEQEAGVLDCSFWSIVIETADAGFIGSTPVDGVGDFLRDDADWVAQILAYESITHDIPLAYPENWTDPGSITHTEPFPYPYFTIRKGKICPGPAKKKTFREQILPRARQIRAAWLEEDIDDMITLDEPYRSYDSADGDGPLMAGATRKVPVVFASGPSAGAEVLVTLISSAGQRGWVSVTGRPEQLGKTVAGTFENRDGVQILNLPVPVKTPDGHAYVRSMVDIDRIVVDVRRVSK